MGLPVTVALPFALMCGLSVEIMSTWSLFWLYLTVRFCWFRRAGGPLSPERSLRRLLSIWVERRVGSVCMFFPSIDPALLPSAREYHAFAFECVLHFI